ncbi:FecR family protein [Chitinophaga oryzae]|uniref:FecR family protein n=1 Tax=Chitinophaga oryzae TaxID=2725414 RepID=A0AAE7D8P3_9BACT|nr:FecR domain-containing protein [Chitinophaga oryzae]QJB33467.1 FecR family protein [Chitinophaga oryzae]QJB39985.1 FecR family protein [Chitinophaga oryzae]
MHNRKEYLRQLLHTENWSATEQEWMLQYLEENDLSDLEAVAKEYFQAEGPEIKNLLDERLSARLLKKIHRRAGISQPGIFALYGRKIAAAAAVVLLAGASWYLLVRQQVKQLVMSSGNQHKTVTLPDGSMVYLEKSSSITYPENFGKKNRTLQLNGEAFFDVKQNSKHPFVISSALINTTVLGTSFNMEARNNGVAKVVVVSGSVQVNTRTGETSPQHQLVLGANKSAVYHAASRGLELIDATDDARFFRQKQSGKFTYKGQPLSAVLNDLQRFYNVPVSADKKMERCSFFGDFNTTDDLQETLTIIAVTLNASIKKDANGNGYVIVDGNCH